MTTSNIVSKEKRIREIAVMLEQGMETKDILHTVAQTCTKSIRTVKEDIMRAKIIVLARIKEAEDIRRQHTSEVLKEAIRDGLKSNIEIELRLLKIGWAEMDIEETTTSDQFGTTTFRRKPTPAEQKAALAEVLKIRGAYAPLKTAQTDVAGNDKEFNITLNIA